MMYMWRHQVEVVDSENSKSVIDTVFVEASCKVNKSL